MALPKADCVIQAGLKLVTIVLSAGIIGVCGTMFFFGGGSREEKLFCLYCSLSLLLSILTAPTVLQLVI